MTMLIGTHRRPKATHRVDEPVTVVAVAATAGGR